MMRFTAERQHLLAAVKRASGVIQPRNVIPALACVRLQATDTGLAVYASNLKEWVKASCEAAVTVPGQICVNAALLLTWLNATPKGALVSFELRDHRAFVSAGRLSADFATLDATDAPMHEVPSDLVEVHGALEALSACLPYAAADDVRYYLKGVAINRGHVVGLDGFKMCAVDIGADPVVSAIIPTAAVRQITACSPSARLFLSPLQWALEDEGCRLGGRLIDGEFPDWSRLVGQFDGQKIAIDCDAMQEAIAGVAMADDARERCVRLSGAKGEVSVSARGSAASAGAVIPYEGDDFAVAFNPKNISPALDTFAGRVASVVTDPGRALFQCEAAPNVRALIMGMRA